MKYDDEFIAEISKKVDLLSYASQSFSFQKKSDNYFTNCPLHIDKTPSLAICPEKNAFYCYSCGRGGGIIQWLMIVEKLSFDAAVKKTATLAGTDVSLMCQSETVKYNRSIQQMRKKTTENYKHKILDYAVFEQYSKGYIKEWINEGIRQQEIDEFDIRIDNKSNRIVYPVFDIDGNLINVKGRTRFENYKRIGIPKYINYYEVGTMDYFQSLEKSLPYIKESGEVKIFESIKSVMKLYGNNEKNVISAEKHTLTKEQIVLLIKLGVDVVFCYDSDVNYNDKAVRENLNLLKKFTNVYVIKDSGKLLGGTETKNSPIDCGYEIWQQLYNEKVKIH